MPAKKNYVDGETVPKEGRGVAPFPYKNHSWVGGGDKIKILELDFLHLHEGVAHKMMRFGENQSSLA